MVLSIYVISAKDYILGEKVYCRFHIAQHSKDLELMQFRGGGNECHKCVACSELVAFACEYDTVNYSIKEILQGNVLEYKYPISCIIKWNYYF